MKNIIEFIKKHQNLVIGLFSIGIIIYFGYGILNIIINNMSSDGGTSSSFDAISKYFKL